MIAEPARTPATLLDEHLLEQLHRLAPELRGFPVEHLLEWFLHAEEPERQRAYLVTDTCLSNWIARLEQPVGRAHAGMPEVIDQIEQRQRGARDALASMHAALAMAGRHRSPPPHGMHGPS